MRLHLRQQQQEHEQALGSALQVGLASQKHAASETAAKQEFEELLAAMGTRAEVDELIIFALKDKASGLEAQLAASTSRCNEQAAQLEHMEQSWADLRTQKAQFYSQLSELQKVHSELQVLFQTTEGDLQLTRATLAERETQWEHLMSSLTADVASFSDRLADSQHVCQTLQQQLAAETAAKEAESKARQAAEGELQELMKGLQAACRLLAADVQQLPAANDSVWQEYGSAGGRQLVVSLLAQQLELKQEALALCHKDIAVMQVRA